MEIEHAIFFGVIGLVLCGAIGSACASQGNSTKGFWLAFLLGPLGVLIALLLPVSVVSGPNVAQCPDCLKIVSRRAVSCPNCGAPL